MLTDILGKWSNNLFFKNIVIVTGGNFASRLIGILSAPVITRLYNPTEFGIYSIFIAYAGIAFSFSTLRYAITIPLEKDTSDAENLLKLSFTITSVLSIFLTFAILLYDNEICSLFAVRQLKPYFWIFPLIFWGQGIFEALSYWVMRERDFSLITKAKINQGIASTIVKIGFGVFGITPLGLFGGTIAQESFGIIRLYKKVQIGNPSFLKEYKYRNIINVAKRYKKFPLIQTWSQILLSGGFQLPLIFVGSLYNNQVVGAFGFAISIVSIPMNLIGQSVSQVYYAEISKYGTTDPLRIYRLSLSLIKKMFYLSLLPTVILIFFGPLLFSFVFGEEWGMAGKFAQIISVLILFRFISSPIMHCLNVFKMQWLQFLFNLLRIVLIVVVFYLAGLLQWDTQSTLIYYSVTIAFFYSLVVLKILTFLKSRF